MRSLSTSVPEATRDVSQSKKQKRQKKKEKKSYFNSFQFKKEAKRWGCIQGSTGVVVVFADIDLM